MAGGTLLDWGVRGTLLDSGVFTPGTDDGSICCEPMGSAAGFSSEGVVAGVEEEAVAADAVARAARACCLDLQGRLSRKLQKTAGCRIKAT